MNFACEADISRIIEMGERFHKQTLTTDFDPQRFRQVIENLMRFGAVFVTDHGFLAGTIMQNVSDNGLTAHEVLWWSEDGRGQELRRWFETWADEKRCTAVEFSFPSGRGRVGKALARVGYRPATQVMRKEF